MRGFGLSLVVTFDSYPEYPREPEKLDTGFQSQILRGSSSKTLLSVGEAWLGRRPDTAKVAGSNPAEPTSSTTKYFEAYAVNWVLTLRRINERDTSAVTTPYTRWKMKLPPANIRFDKSVGASMSATGT